MGCDIHIVAQQLRDDGTWSEIPFDPDLEVRHNYDAFAALANVRNRGNIKPISEARGVPQDFAPNSDPEWHDGWFDPADRDAHSHSRLLLSEIYAYDWTGIDGYAPNGCTFADVCHRSFDLFGDPERIRLVFCFDN